MDSAAIIRELETRATELEAEARRLRAAVDLLKGVNPSRGSAPAMPSRPTNKPGSVGTMSLIISTLGELGPLSNVELTDALKNRGWKTSSEVPANTVRTAVGRLIDRNTVVRLDDGRFALRSASAIRSFG